MQRKSKILAKCNMLCYTGTEGFKAIKKEVIADLAGDYLFQDAEFVKRLTTNRKLYQKVWDEIKYLSSIVQAGTEEEKKLLKAMKAFENAYNADTKARKKNGTKTNADGEVSTQLSMTGTDKSYISMEDFVNKESPVWRNVDYNDNSTKLKIMRETHETMVGEGLVVKVSDEVSGRVDESFPDLRGMKKKERVPILKESMQKLKENLRQFLGGLKNQGFEFEVNGKVLEAKLYTTGINEVLEKVTQDKANMLYTTEEIFRNARYLYSTPDYASDPNVYRWNYFYTPVQIGDAVVGVRIAVRDLAKQGESQIYNWGIKKDTSLDGVGDDLNNRKSYDVSSDVSKGIIAQKGKMSIPNFQFPRIPMETLSPRGNRTTSKTPRL